MKKDFTTISIRDRELHSQLKIKAIQLKVDLVELVERYLKESLIKDK